MSMRFILVTALFSAVAAMAAAQAPIPAPPDVARAPADAAKTRSGLASRVITPGKGTTHPQGDDFVTVNYTGWTTDGRMFDSSVVRKEPATFPLNRVIAGWTEGVQLMVPGETRRFWIPEDLAYGGKRDPKGMLVFDVELISFVPDPSKPPADVKAPPGDARKTASGLAYKVLKAGSGKTRPSASNTVSVNYTGWTTDGKMFDSSAGGPPVTFPLGQVIAGWTEGVQLMVEGEKTRFWIPEALAYQGRQDPRGMLVFDVELVKIQ